MIRTLALVSPDREAGLAPCLAYLGTTDAAQVTTTGDPDRLRALDGVDVVVADTSLGPLDPGQEAGLCAFVAGGGGFVGLDGTSHAWRTNAAFLQLLGSKPDGRLPESELVARAAGADHPVVRRLPLPLVVREPVARMGALRPDCEVVLSASWRLEELPLAYCRPVGRGRVVALALGAAPRTLADPGVQQLLHRAVRYAAGVEERAAIGIGLLGYGAIAAEHLQAIAAVPGLRLAAVCDRSPERLLAAARAVPEANRHRAPASLLADPQVEAVVVSTPPNTHHPMARAVLEAGRHVVVEKPVCLTRREADDLMGAARAAGRVLTVFQNRRWDPDFLAVRRVVASGRLGEVFHAETFVGGHQHPCGLWHSDATVSGGVVFDWGAHYLDWLLAILPGRVERVSAFGHKRRWHDVTNHDQLRLIMTLEGGVQAEFMHSDIAAARKPKWYLLGTRAALVGSWRETVRPVTAGPGHTALEPVPPTDLPADLHVLTPDGAGGTDDERLTLPAVPPHPFYRNLAGHLLSGEPLAVAPAEAARTVAVMEAAMVSAARGGEPIPLER